jgi:hypothetical protein
MPAYVDVFYPEHGSSMILRKVSTHLPHCSDTERHTVNVIAHSSTRSHECRLSQMLIVNCLCIPGFTYRLAVGARRRFLGAFT